jgi:hypothetical protein
VVRRSGVPAKLNAHKESERYSGMITNTLGA